MTLSTDKCRYYLYNSIDQWVQITEEEYDHFLNCVPPLAFNGTWFLVGEAQTQLNNGKSIYLACKEEDGKYYCKYMTVEKYVSRDTKVIEYDQLYRWSGVMNLQMPEGQEPFPFADR